MVTTQHGAVTSGDELNAAVAHTFDRNAESDGACEIAVRRNVDDLNTPGVSRQHQKIGTGYRVDPKFEPMQKKAAEAKK